MQSDFIRCQQDPAGYAELIIDRPAARNALCRSLTDAMADHLERLAAAPDVRVVLLRAEGDHFAAGADIKEMLDISAEQARGTDFAGCCAPLGDFPKPVVALVQGFALGGGCELVEMCDIVLAAENAVFGHPEVRVGTLSGAGGTQRLPRLLGMAKALDLLLTGRRMDAREAERGGLVSRVVPTEHLLEEGRRLVADMASLSGEVLLLIKRTARSGASLPLQEGLRRERAAFHHSLSLADREEGMRAFLEKRAPRFNIHS
ncbi:enoyl-CoA hydratase/isomerase family protein [Alloalcanivorax sp. C16-2]|uniref:enoyl-CoA hydratase/isomerase family protein n=1 Tax=Alloalcanivorax TaxID=3020832 RepID=UPI0019337E11|nr:enoyl-CoA hydratase-related protein [Alloalcanivorax marinus]MBL7249119.1 enoyl-CoA hydratase/isomerase family protein [Alloalcanivorax marinus]